MLNRIQSVYQQVLYGHSKCTSCGRKVRIEDIWREILGEGAKLQFDEKTNEWLCINCYLEMGSVEPSKMQVKDVVNRLIGTNFDIRHLDHRVFKRYAPANSSPAPASSGEDFNEVCSAIENAKHACSWTCPDCKSTMPPTIDSFGRSKEVRCKKPNRKED